MDPILKDRWVTALRSGEYNQTQGELSDGQGGFCCLGVLCEILTEDGVVRKNPPSYHYGSARSATLLPGDLSKVLGLDDGGAGAVFDYSEVKHLLTEEEQEKVETDLAVAYPSPDNSKWSLANLNDVGVSFETISKIIEEKL